MIYLTLSGCSQRTSTQKTTENTAINNESSTQITKESTSESESDSSSESVTPTEDNTPIERHTLISPAGKMSIVRKPPSADYSYLFDSPLNELPSYDPDQGFYDIDIRHADLTQLDLTHQMDALKFVTFDTHTKWPNKLPKEFNLERIMQYGKDPGLNVKNIHRTGITGKGVGIAILDQALLVEHEEYKDQLKLYEEINCSDEMAQMHGSAVASIALGKNVGVAPGANLYYIAETVGQRSAQGKFEYDYTIVAKNIDRIIEINQLLPQDEKIRVISISLGFRPDNPGYTEFTEAVARALKDNIYTVTVSSEHFDGAGRDMLTDPNDFNSFQNGLFYTNEYPFEKTLLVPMDSRCIAAPNGPNDYAFYRDGGMSWAVPYVAGLYALACETKPSITPEEFWNHANQTKKEITFDFLGKDTLSYLIDPVALINSLK